MHQTQFSDVEQDGADFSDLVAADTRRLLPNAEAQDALDEYLQECDRNGVSVTRAMVRKKAAILAAKTWMDQNRDLPSQLPASSSNESVDLSNESFSQG